MECRKGITTQRTKTMAAATRTTDEKARISLPPSFANSTVLIEQVSDTEIRIRKARVIPEDELPFLEESMTPLSDRDRDIFLALLENPPPPNEALRRLMDEGRQRRRRAHARGPEVRRAEGTTMANVPPAVRILPMAKEEFDKRTAEEVQSQYFLGELPSPDRDGRYYHHKRGLDAEAGTVVLFQYDNRVIASAVFLRRERFQHSADGYRGALYFDPMSIRVFKPVGTDVLREVWPGEFTGFNQVMQSLSPAAYPAFERRLAGVESPGVSVS
jgi:hypothetical protein